MDISFISSLMGSLAQPNLPKEEYNQLVAQLKGGAREMLSSLVAHPNNSEHITITCHVLSTLNQEHDLLEVQTVLPDIITLLMEPRTVRSPESLQAHMAVVSLLEELVVYQFLPNSASILQTLLMDTATLLTALLDTISQQELRSLVSTRRQPVTIACFSDFFNCELKVVSETSKAALSKLDASHLSRNTALLIGLFNLLCKLLPHSSTLKSSDTSVMWAVIRRAIAHYTPYLVDSEPSAPKIFALDAALHAAQTLLTRSYIPTSLMMTHFVADVIQSALVAVFTSHSSATRTLWRSVYEALGELLYMLAGISTYSLTAMPAGLVPSLADKLSECSDWSILRALFSLYHSRLKISFVPSLTWFSLQNSIPKMLTEPELRFTSRMFAKSLFDLDRRTVLAPKQLSSAVLKVPTHSTKHLSVENPFESPAKRPKLSELDLKLSPLKHEHSTHKVEPKEPSFARFIQTLASITTQLFADASQAIKSNRPVASTIELELRALNASITLIKIQLDTLEIRAASTTRRKKASTNSSSASSSLTNLLQFKLTQRSDIDQLSNGILVTARLVADFLLERLTPPKIAPLPLFTLGSEFLDAMIELMTILPPHDTQLPGATAGLLGHLCEVPFANLASAHSAIQRPSLFPMPTGDARSLAQANAQLDRSPEVTLFAEKALVFSALLSHRSSEPQMCSAALSDSRPRVVHAALRHFALAMARFGENALSNGDVVHSAFQAASTLCKSILPLSTTSPAPADLMESVDTLCHFANGIACLTQAERFGEDLSDEFRYALVRDNCSPHPRFDILCCNHCSRTSQGAFFWKSTSPRAQLIASSNYDWSTLSRLFSEYRNDKLDPKLRLLLIDAHKSVFHHCTLPQAKNRSNARSSPGTLSKMRSASRLSPTAMDVDNNNTTTESGLPKEVALEIAALFELAVNGPTADLSLAASDAIISMLELESEKGKSAVNNAILNEMSNATASLNKSTSQPQPGVDDYLDSKASEEALLRLVGKIGGRAKGWYVLPPLFLLLNYLTDLRVSIKACAYENLVRMSSEHGVSPRELLKQHEPKIGVHLAKSLRKPGPLLDEVCLTILDVDPTEYLMSFFNVLLPKIALKKDGDLLELVAKRTKKSAPSILLDSMTPILVAAVCKPNIPFEIVEFVVDKVKITAGELFTRYMKGILLGVVLRLGDKSKKRIVINSMDLLVATLRMTHAPATSSQHSKSRRTSKGSENTPSTSQQYNSREDLIAANFLQISNRLVYEHILKTSAPLASRLNALNAYKRLIGFLGSHIDKFYVIIGSILRLTMTEVPELRSATCKAWKSFLKHVPDRCLGPILGATTVYLLSYDAYESEIAPILEYLFVTKENVLGPYFRDVPLLPDRPALAKVHAKWREYQPEGNILSGGSRNRESSLRAQLSQLIMLARNDDCSIREMALKQLINFLHLHRSELATSMQREQGIDSVMVQLVDLLVNGSRESVPSVRSKFAQALGELGAIDPSRLANKLPPSVTVPVLDHTEEQFAADLIESYLVKTYRTARLVSNQDRACFTIQEVLAYFDCDSGTATRTTARRDTSLWSKLTPTTRALVHPFLASQYILNRPDRWLSSSQLPASAAPVSAYQPGMSYAVWLEHWLERLIIDSKSSLFQACIGILSTHDLDTAHYILPHVVLSILHNGSPAARESILHEMLVVLGARPASDGRPGLIPQRLPHPDAINSMAAQRIFSLIDALSQWVESKYAQFRENHAQWTTESKENGLEINSTPQPKVDPRVTNVEDLLSKIPQLDVCKTALSINAHSRALMHFEKAAREGSASSHSSAAGIPPLKPIVETSEIALVQRIFASLDDPDALAGIAHLRPSGKSVSDMLESFRAAGRWNETLIALDQLVRQKNGDAEATSSLQVGRLECLAELGLFDQLLNLATTCLNDPSQASQEKHMQKVRSFGAHAAWKLGDWKTIETLLSAHSKQSGIAPYQMFTGNFDLGIGQIFLALRNKKRTQFENVLLVMRNDIIQPLGAASLESYDRAYPMIVRLQMLNELEDSWRLLYGVDGGADINGVEVATSSVLPYGRDSSNPINVSITHPDNLDKSIGGLIQGRHLNASTSVMDTSMLQGAARATPTLPIQGTMSLSDRTLNERAKILHDWNVRLSLTQYSYKVREAVLSLRLAVFGLADMHKEATDTWMELTRMARKTSKFTMAQYANLHVRDGSELAAALESSKLLWASGEHAKALIEVEKIVEQSASASSNPAASGTASNAQGANGTEPPKSSAELSRQRLMDARQNSGTISTSQRSKSSLSRSGSSSVGKIMSDKDLLSSARLLKARWMRESQYAVSSVQTAFREAMASDQTSLLMKFNYYSGLFSDHLCTEYKRKLYSLPPKTVVPKSSKRTTSTSSKLTPVNATTIPPMLTQQAQQYWVSIRHAFSSLTYSLVRSTTYCYQILPRLISMWFEISEALQDLFVQYPDPTLHNVSSPGNEPWNLKIPNKKMFDASDKTAKLIVESYLTAMSLVQKLLGHIPSYAWLISYSLLISGCVNRNKDVEDLIGRIILKVLSEYPQQAIWHIFPLNYSNNEVRQGKYNWIRKQTAHYTVKERDGSESSLYQFFDEAASLAHQFTVLCGYKAQRDKGSTTLELRLSDTCQIEQKIPKALIMPSEQQLSCVQFLDASRDSKNPFAYQPVYIRRAHPKVSILRSLARPRKLILYGSDEQEYWFLCKPVDDLRKDARMMEFSGMVNRLLKKDLETRKRELRIRTYSVLPLSDNSGILNWVPNTNGLRGVISDVYAMDGMDLTEKIREIRKWYESTQNKEDWKAQFEEKLLPKFPLALSKWFLQQFPEPSSWLRARTNFARTCGVMSVVGTILGLGDRHCENILVDSKTGDCLHVDLNCIFHKGRSFAIPEVVPFRLTRNMVDAFGITGVEGPFRRACELTMQIMTQNKDALISVLGTFVHDPLLEWSTDSPSASSMTRQSTTNPKPDPLANAYSHERHNKLAVEILNGIADRLDGLMRTPDNLDQLIVPLSTEGYVDAIIAEATSNANLCKMYVGWSSFL